MYIQSPTLSQQWSFKVIISIFTWPTRNLTHRSNLSDQGQRASSRAGVKTRGFVLSSLLPEHHCSLSFLPPEKGSVGRDTGADAPIRGGSPPCPEHAQADVPAVGHWRQEASLTDSLSQAFRTERQQSFPPRISYPSLFPGGGVYGQSSGHSPGFEDDHEPWLCPTPVPWHFTPPSPTGVLLDPSVLPPHVAPAHPARAQLLEVAAGPWHVVLPGENHQPGSVPHGGSEHRRSQSPPFQGTKGARGARRCPRWWGAASGYSVRPPPPGNREHDGGDNQVQDLVQPCKSDASGRGMVGGQGTTKGQVCIEHLQ